MGHSQSRKTDRDTNSGMASSAGDVGSFPLEALPDEILAEVLLRLPAADLVSSCVYVCKKWREILNSQTLWKQKCKRDYYYTDRMLVSSDFKELYFRNPYNSNLVKNPDAKKDFSDWKITRNGGHGFRKEREPVGSHPVKNFAQCNIDGPVGCWVTSFGECIKEQEIDLLSQGCCPEILDNVRPDICVSEWYAARFDCGCKYSFKVKLLDEKKQILEKYQFTDDKLPGRDWFLNQHVFTAYQPGCRYVKIVHGGKDANWWAGHYGVKITLTTVKFDFSHVAGSFHGDLKPPVPESSSDSSGYGFDYDDEDSEEDEPF